MIAVTTELSDSQAMVLAQFVTRVGWSEMCGSHEKRQAGIPIQTEYRQFLK